MAQEQKYSVNYSINVEATQGTRQVQAFAEAVGNLVKAKADLTPAVTNIKRMMDEIDKTFTDCNPHFGKSSKLVCAQLVSSSHLKRKEA